MMWMWLGRDGRLRAYVRIFGIDQRERWTATAGDGRDSGVGRVGCDILKSLMISAKGGRMGDIPRGMKGVGECNWLPSDGQLKSKFGLTMRAKAGGNGGDQLFRDGELAGRIELCIIYIYQLIEY
mmetsp:Transcript_44329/g.135042  ORF Transcript_44329/g.135042 Transcript_44329/m.135042 type:complete len:125 (+) Transcript_44329:1213-1587(+)